MQFKSRTFPVHLFFQCLLLFGLSSHSIIVLAWGANGHTTVGVLAVKQLSTHAHSELELIMGRLDQQSIEKACNWPDEVRETGKWEWTYPLHFINIPRGDFEYLESRDCPEKLCATEAIKRYAGELGDPRATKKSRQQAFAWLCHFTGDLHQPLHAGFADDRGGNNFEVDFRGEQTNLHSVWDSGIINQHTDTVEELAKTVSSLPQSGISENWSPEMVNRWTDESHQIAIDIYPPSSEIDACYERQNWELIKRQINIAASRLAMIMNSELSE